MRGGKIIPVLLLFVLCRMPLDAAFEDSLASGARASGMGGAFTAVEHNGSGALVNPASLSVGDGSVTALYSPLFAGLDDGSFDHGLFNIAYQFSGIGAFSLNWEFLKTSTSAVPGLYQEDRFALTYTRRIRNNLFLGLMVSLYQWSSAEQQDLSGQRESLSARAFSLGTGAFYKPGNDFKIGLFMNNVNMPRIDDASRGREDLERMPFTGRLGISFDIKRITLALDLAYAREIADLTLGAEYWFFRKKERFIGARLGAALPDLGAGVNATAGLSFFIMKGFSFDYAFLMPLVTIKSIYGSHLFSMSYQW